MAAASASVRVDGDDWCLGEMAGNPATAVNVAKEGDCIRYTGGTPERLDCANSTATYQVVKRIEDPNSLYDPFRIGRRSLTQPGGTKPS